MFHLVFELGPLLSWFSGHHSSWPYSGSHESAETALRQALWCALQIYSWDEGFCGRTQRPQNYEERGAILAVSSSHQRHFLCHMWRESLLFTTIWATTLLHTTAYQVTHSWPQLLVFWSMMHPVWAARIAQESSSAQTGRGNKGAKCAAFGALENVFQSDLNSPNGVYVTAKGHFLTYFTNHHSYYNQGITQSNMPSPLLIYERFDILHQSRQCAQVWTIHVLNWEF